MTPDEQFRLQATLQANAAAAAAEAAAEAATRFDGEPSPLTKAVNRALDDLLVCKRCKGDGFVPTVCKQCDGEHEDALTGETETDECPACFGSTVEPLTVELVRAARLIVGMAPSGEPFMSAKLRLYESAMLAIRYGTVAQHEVEPMLKAAMGDET